MLRVNAPLSGEAGLRDGAWRGRGQPPLQVPGRGQLGLHPPARERGRLLQSHPRPGDQSDGRLRQLSLPILLRRL